MIVEFFIDDEGKYRYRYKALNGRVLVTSHGFSTYRKCCEGWGKFSNTLRETGGWTKVRWSKKLAEE